MAEDSECVGGTDGFFLGEQTDEECAKLCFVKMATMFKNVPNCKCYNPVVKGFCEIASKDGSKLYRFGKCGIYFTHINKKRLSS